MAILTLAAASAAISLPMFALFILEEAVQAASFGLFVLTGGKQWEQARVHLQAYESIVDSLDEAVKAVKKLIAVPSKARQIIDFLPIVVDSDKETLFDVITRFLVNPYEQFVIASRANVAAYESRISEELEVMNPQFFKEKEEVEMEIDLDKFDLKQRQDEKLDDLRLERTETLQAFAEKKKLGMQELRKMKRDKKLSTTEFNAAVIELDREINEIRNKVRDNFNDIDRAARKVFFKEKFALDRKAELSRIAVRQKFFPPDIITPIPPGPETPPPAEVAESFEGEVQRVLDGDTVEVDDIRIRLGGINAPELGTEGGDTSKDALTNLVLGKDVTVLSDKTRQFDIFNRLLAVIKIETRDINLLMLEGCFAELDIRGGNRHIDEAAYKAAAAACKAPPEEPPPGEPAPPPEEPPAEPPADRFNLTIRIREADKTLVPGILVTLTHKGVKRSGFTDDAGEFKENFSAGSIVTVKVDARPNFKILPTLIDDFTYEATVDKNLVNILEVQRVTPPVTGENVTITLKAETEDGAPLQGVPFNVANQVFTSNSSGEAVFDWLKNSQLVVRTIAPAGFLILPGLVASTGTQITPTTNTRLVFRFRKT